MFRWLPVTRWSPALVPEVEETAKEFWRADNAPPGQKAGASANPDGGERSVAFRRCRLRILRSLASVSLDLSTRPAKPTPAAAPTSRRSETGRPSPSWRSRPARSSSGSGVAQAVVLPRRVGLHRRTQGRRHRRPVPTAQPALGDDPGPHLSRPLLGLRAPDLSPVPHSRSHNASRRGRPPHGRHAPRDRPWIAFAATVPFVFLGSAYDVIVPFQVAFTGALVFGLIHLLLADHDGPSIDVAQPGCSRGSSD